MQRRSIAAPWPPRPATTAARQADKSFRARSRLQSSHVTGSLRRRCTPSCRSGKLPCEPLTIARPAPGAQVTPTTRIRPKSPPVAAPASPTEPRLAAAAAPPPPALVQGAFGDAEEGLRSRLGPGSELLEHDPPPLPIAALLRAPQSAPMVLKPHTVSEFPRFRRPRDSWRVRIRLRTISTSARSSSSGRSSRSSHKLVCTLARRFAFPPAAVGAAAAGVEGTADGKAGARDADDGGPSCSHAGPPAPCIAQLPARGD